MSQHNQNPDWKLLAIGVLCIVGGALIAALLPDLSLVGAGVLFIGIILIFLSDPLALFAILFK